MGHSRYETSRRGGNGFLYLFGAVNFAMMTGSVLAWQAYSSVLADPLSLVAGSGRGGSGVFEYPSLLLWSIPLAAILFSFIAKAIGQTSLARFIAAFPTLLVIGSAGWLVYSGNIKV